MIIGAKHNNRPNINGLELTITLPKLTFTGDKAPSFTAPASWTPNRVTGAGCWIWIELGRGVGRMLAGLTLQTCIGDGLVAPLTSGLVRTCNEAQTLHKLPIWFTSLIAGIEASLVNFRLRAHAYRQCYGTRPGAGQPN